MEVLKQKLKPQFVALLLLAGIGLVCYANSFGNKMFWDDYDLILNNSFVKNFSIHQIFTQNVIGGAGLVSNYWRPVLSLIFAIEYKLWGAHIFGWHLINLCFHISDAFLLFYFLLKLWKNYWLALLTALVFVAHPVQTEAVTYVNSLGDSLSVFFMLAGLNLYLKSRLHALPSYQTHSFWLAVGLFPLALMSKETAIILPAFIVLTEVFIAPIGDFKNFIKRIFLGSWPWFAIAAVYILMRATVLNFQNTFNLYNSHNPLTDHFYVRIFTFFHALSVYLKLIFVPIGLHMERSLPFEQHISLPVAVGGVFALGCLATIILNFKKNPEISFGLLWFFLALAPTSNIAVPINGLMYEHWLYLPLAGFFFSLIYLIAKVTVKPHFRTAALGIFILMLLFLVQRTIVRNRDWQNPITFYNQTLKYAPNSYRILNNLGMAYDDANDQTKAIENYDKAIAIDAKNPVAFNNLGNTYRNAKQFDLAAQNYKQALSLDPGFIFAYYNFAQSFLDQKKYPEARGVLEQLSQRQPDNLSLQILLSQIAYEEKNYPKMIDYLKAAQKLNPSDQSIQADIDQAERLVQ